MAIWEAVAAILYIAGGAVWMPIVADVSGQRGWFHQAIIALAVAAWPVTMPLAVGHARRARRRGLSS